MSDTLTSVCTINSGYFFLNAAVMCENNVQVKLQKAYTSVGLTGIKVVLTEHVNSLYMT